MERLTSPPETLTIPIAFFDPAGPGIFVWLGLKPTHLGI